MMRKITSNFVGHPLSNVKFPQSLNFMCIICATGKLVLKISSLKRKVEPLKFLKRIQDNLCGPMQPLSRPFRYFMVLIDTSTRWSHVSLLSIRNHVFDKIIAQVIKLKAQHSKHQIKSIRMDNTAEFFSHAINGYCLAWKSSPALCPICPYSKWVSRISHQENQTHYKTIVIEL